MAGGRVADDGTVRGVELAAVAVTGRRRCADVVAEGRRDALHREARPVGALGRAVDRRRSRGRDGGDGEELVAVDHGEVGATAERGAQVAAAHRQAAEDLVGRVVVAVVRDERADLDRARPVPVDRRERDLHLDAGGDARAGGLAAIAARDARDVGVVERRRHFPAAAGRADRLRAHDVRADQGVVVALPDVATGTAAIREQLRVADVHRVRRAAACREHHDRVGVEAGVEREAGRQAVGRRAHGGVQTVEVDVRVVASERVLAGARTGVNEHVDLVEVRLEVAREHEVQRAGCSVARDEAVGHVELAAVADARGGPEVVAKAGADALDDDGASVAGLGGSVDDIFDARERERAAHERRSGDERGLHVLVAPVMVSWDTKPWRTDRRHGDQTVDPRRRKSNGGSVEGPGIPGIGVGVPDGQRRRYGATSS